jgi:hypothetical protein
MANSIQIKGDELVAVILDRDFHFSVSLSPWIFWVLVGFIVTLIAVRFGGPYLNFRYWRTFEIDQAQFGLGQQKVTLRPNEIDRQIAYKIWVELSTRRIGLPIDLSDDVIFEIYDSWYQFFSVTRDLIKDVPVSRFRRKDTEQIIRLSIEVLNTGLRPHLTKWQARFRHWYEHALASDEKAALDPQDIQKTFPDYAALEADLKAVNVNLIRYRDKMYELVTNL